MGKAQIVGGGMGGLYSVRAVYDQAFYDAEIVKLDKIIVDRTADLERLANERAPLASALLAAEAALEQAIAAYIATPVTETQQVKDALGAYTSAQAAARTAGIRLAECDGRIEEAQAAKAGAQARKVSLESAGQVEPRDAWCADYSESVAGEVATIEVPGEPQSILVRPQSPPDADQDYSAPRDGVLVPREWQSPAQAYFNAAILPGWQRHKPTYRSATLLDVDPSANVCKIELDDAKSSAQELPVTPDVRVLEGVPVSYMTCNAAAFEVGDRVVVEFVGGAWSSPRVIGFFEHPRPCLSRRLVWLPEGFLIQPSSAAAPDGWGLPIDDDGNYTAGGAIRQALINRQPNNNYPDSLGIGGQVSSQAVFFRDDEDSIVGPRGARIGTVFTGIGFVPQFTARWQQQYREPDDALNWYCHRPQPIAQYKSGRLEAIFAETNQVRAGQGVAPCYRPLRGVYNAEADSVVREMVRAGLQMHESDQYVEGYRSFADRIARGGWVYYAGGENLVTSSPQGETPSEFGSRIVQAWVGSPYHYANLVYPWANPADASQAGFMMLDEAANTVTAFESEPGGAPTLVDPPVSGMSVAQVFQGTNVWLFAMAAVYQGQYGTVSWAAQSNCRYYIYEVMSLWDSAEKMQAYRQFAFAGRVSEQIPWGDPTFDSRGIIGAGVTSVEGAVRFRVVTLRKVSLNLYGTFQGQLELWDIPGDGRMSGATILATSPIVSPVMGVHRAIFSHDGSRVVVGVHRGKYNFSAAGIRQDQVNFNLRPNVNSYLGTVIDWYEFSLGTWSLRSTEELACNVIEAKTEPIGTNQWRNTFARETVGQYKWLADYSENTLIYATVHVDMRLDQTADFDFLGDPLPDYLADFYAVNMRSLARSSQADVEVKIVWPDASEFVCTQTTSTDYSLAGFNCQLIDYDIRAPSQMTYARLDLANAASTINLSAALTLIRAGQTIKTLPNILPPDPWSYPLLWDKGCAWGGGIQELYPTRTIFNVDLQQQYWFGHWPQGTSYDQIRKPHSTYGNYADVPMSVPAWLMADTIGGSQYGPTYNQMRPDLTPQTRAAPAGAQDYGAICNLSRYEYNGEWILSGLFRTVFDAPTAYGFGGNSNQDEWYMWRSSLDLDAITGVTLRNNLVVCRVV